jgi:hypothetical protein
MRRPGQSGDKHWSRRMPELIPRGERKGNARLTEAAVIEARELRERGWTLERLGERYGVDMSTIGYVLRGVTWTHVGHEAAAVQS